MNKAIFLDRDGVINTTLLKMGKMRAPYSMEEFSFIQGVVESVKILKEHGFKLIVVTNQPDVARGWVSRDAVDLLNAYVKKALGVDDVVACFHTEKDGCECRKPRPGMLTSSAQKWHIDLALSFMVGDRMSDIEAGLKAGCKTILVGDAEADSGIVSPHHRTTDLSTAVKWILN
jgi:D-glycero-D-manno-heptose 1,7-bisphosphate phosphatase